MLMNSFSTSQETPVNLRTTYEVQLYKTCLAHIGIYGCYSIIMQNQFKVLIP